MKKLLVFIPLILLLFPMKIAAQSYDELWKQVEAASRKDLPKTAIVSLRKIEKKAQHEKAYGQLLAANFLASSIQTQISPDSMDVELNKLKAKAQQAERKDEVLSAIYNCVLGWIEQGKSDGNSAEYFKKALANPSLLARQKAANYTPLVKIGKDDHIFGGDLLHVIGMQARDFDKLNHYYVEHGNREAACYTALLAVDEKDNKSELLDSLMRVYGDLPICGEVAISKYNCMKEDEEPAEKLVTFIDNALSRWPTWAPIEQLRNERKELTAPMSTAEVERNRVTSKDKDNTVQMEVRNVPSLTINITRTSLKGNTQYNEEDKNDLKAIKASLIPSSKQVIQRTYKDYKDYEILKDSFNLPALPVGVYLLEFVPSDSRLARDYSLYYVSDLFVMTEEQPDKRNRYVVVDANEGQPVPGATIRIEYRKDNWSSKPLTKILTTDSKGEAFITDPGYSSDVYVYTSKDQAFPAMDLKSNYDYYEADKNGEEANLYTDRSLYRPGQTVHASAIVYLMTQKGFKMKAEAGVSFDMILRDTNGKEVSRKAVTTDRFGTAAVDFELPNSGLTGDFTIITNSKGGGQVRFKVEEYKRPTFEVSFDDYKEKYTIGDTIQLKGHAKSFAGVPVQNAKVTYCVKRRPMRWWWDSYESDEDVKIGNVVTDEKGDFIVSVPFVLSKEVEKEMVSNRSFRPRFYHFEVEAEVTDAGGESREGSVSLPLGTNPTTLACDIPDKNLRDSLKTITFDYLNMAGQPIDGTVKYVIVPQQKDEKLYVYNNYATAKANEDVTLKPMSSGAYRLHAICGTDTVNTDFVLFSMDDKQPVITTHDWFYLSDNFFPRDGSPIYLQVGSSDKNQHVVYSIYAGNKVIETGSFDQSNSIKTRKLFYKEEYGDGITLNYAWVKDGVLYSHMQSIARPLPDKRLITEWSTFRDKLTPGQKEEWIVSIKRPDGKAADAQLMATLYDKSLDAIIAHSWMLSPYFSLSQSSVLWEGADVNPLTLSAYADIKKREVPELSLSEFDNRYLGSWDSPFSFRYGKMKSRNYALMSRAVELKAMPMSDSVESRVFSVAEQMPSMRADRAAVKYTAPVIKYDEEIKTEEEKEDKKVTPSMRENLNETAFFYPQLQTDGKGNVSIKFTLPEGLTTWRFIGISHDEEMNHGYLTDEIVAKKSLMIQPNMPRFVRIGDEAMVSARLFNQSDKEVNANAKIEIIDPATEKVLFTDCKEVVLKAQSNGLATYNLSSLLSEKANLLSADQSLLIARFSVEDDGFSDGEQHYLPVLQNKEYVTNTLPFTQNGAGEKVVDINKLFPKNSTAQRLTIEYTNNPNWLMVQALPYVAEANEKNAISLVSAYYANRLAKKIISTSPKIEQTINQWRLETGKETSMMSALEKNQDLKTLALEETPWLRDANNEREQKQMLVRLFDGNQLQNRLSTTLTSLKKLQNPDGSFSWYPGMKGSLYMTVSVVKSLVRLQTLTDKVETSTIVDAAFRYLDKRVGEEVANMKKTEKKYKTLLFPMDELCDYLYSNALAGRKTTQDINYLLDRLSKKPTDLTIYGKARTAVILQQYNKVEKAKEYLQSIKEYMVCTEEKGCYFDTKRAQYSWFDYKISTEVAAIEAVKRITPNDEQTLMNMQRWLLQEKRTQSWDTPLNAVDAIWAFMNDGKWVMENGENAKLTLNDHPLNTLQPTAGIGYIKVTEPMGTQSASDKQELKIQKTSMGTSWGAVYAQFFQPATEVTDAASGLKIKREVLVDSTLTKNLNNLKVGDKIRIRLTIIADRDYDFVQIVDKRAACLEPVNQLSGYHWGYYIAPKDYTTSYYFDVMAKGKHVIETEYYIDRAGVYRTGTCTAQCAYAPEYSGRTGAIIMKVDE